MPSSSKSIRLPQTHQKKKPKLAPTEATLQQQKLEKAAHLWCEAKFNKLHQDHVARNVPAPPNPRDLHNEPDDTDIDEPVINDLNVANDHQEDAVANNIREYVAGRTSRRMREERAWDRIMRHMFVTWMQYSSLTSEWGHHTDWNQNYFDPQSCCCPESAKVERKMDLLDTISK